MNFLLEEEIQRCQKIILGEEVDMGKANCPLCKEFEHHCKGCPVYRKTGQAGCVGTPYDGWVNHQVRFHLIRTSPLQIIPGCPECQSHLKDWISFLESLLEKSKERERVIGPFV